MKLKDKKLIIYIVAFILLVIVICSLVIVNKNNHKEKDSDTDINNEDVNTENIGVSESYDYYSVINYFKLNNLPVEYYGYFYQNDQIDYSDIKNDVKLYMAIRKVITDENMIDVTKKIEIKESSIDKAIKSIFGQDAEYKNESLNGDSCSYSNFKYNKANKTYIQEPGECLETRTDSIIYEFIDTKENDNQLIVQEKVAFVEISYNLETRKIAYNIYKDIEKKEKVITVDSYNIDSYRDLLNTYQYTFKKDSGNYHLQKVELVK